MLFQGIITDKRVRKADVLLFLRLCALMEPGGWIAETQAEIARQMEIDVSNVAKGIGRLVKLGYLRRNDHKGRLTLQVVPEYAHKGPLLFRKHEPPKPQSSE